MPRELWSVEVRAVVDKALGDLKILENALGQLRAKAVNLQANVNGQPAVDNLNRVGQAADNARRKSQTFVDQLRQDFNNFGTIFAKRLAFTFATTVERFILGALRAIPAAFGEAIRVGAQFESAIRKTATVAVAGTGDITAAMTLLGGTAREVGAQTTFTATEIADAMFELVSAGLSVEEVNAAIRSSTEFAIAVQTDLGTAVDLTTQIMKSFGLRAQDLADVADILTGAINRSTLTVGRLQAAMRFAAPAAGAIGLSLSETIAVVGEFVNVTKQGGIAGRAFRFAVQALLAPQEKATKRMRELGVSVLDTSGRLRSITEILTDFARSGMEPATDAAIIFGRRAGPVIAAAINNIRRSLTQGRNSLKEFQDQLEQDAVYDRARKQARAFLDTLTSQFTLTGAKLQELGLILFGQIGGIVNLLVRSFNSFLDVMISTGEVAADLTPILLGLAAALAVQRAGGLGAVLGAVIGLFTNFRGTLAVVTKPLASLANLFGFTGVRAGALRTTIVSFGKKVLGVISPIRLLVAGLISAATRSTALEVVGGRLVSLFSRLRIAGLSLGDIARAVFEGLSDTVTFIFESLVDFIDLVVQYAVDSILELVIGIRQSLEKLPDVLVPDSWLEGLATAETSLRNLSGELARATADQKKFATETEAAQGKFADLQDVLTKQIETVPDLVRAVELVTGAYTNLIDGGTEASDAADFLSTSVDAVKAAADRLNISLDDPGLVAIMLQLEENANAVTTEFQKLVTDGFAALGVSTTDAKDKFKEFSAVMQEVLGDEDLSDEFKSVVAMRMVDEVIEMRDKMVEELGELPPEIAMVFDEMLEEVRNFRNEVDPASREAYEAMILAFEEETSDFGPRIRENLARQIKDPEFQKALDEAFSETFKKGTEDPIATFILPDLPTRRKIKEDIFKMLQDTNSLFDDFVDDLVKGLARGIGDMIVEGRSFADVFQGIIRTMSVNTVGSMIQVFKDGFNASQIEGDTFLNNLGFGFSKLFESMVGWQNALPAAAGAAFGSWSQIGLSAMSSVVNFAKGDLVGGFIAAGGALVGALRKLFTGTPEFKKVAKDIGRQLGVDISEELAKSIADVSKKTGNRFAAISLALPKIIEEAGELTQQSLNNFLRRAEVVFAAFDQGAASATETVNVLIDTLKMLIPEITEKGGSLASVSRIIADIVNRVRLGMVQATDAIRALGETLPLVLTEILEAGGKGFDQLLLQISYVFEGIRDGFFTTQEAADVLSPTIESLIENIEVFGFQGTIALRTIIEAARAAGVEIEALNDFIIEKSQMVVTGISQFIESTVSPTLDELKLASSALLTAFNELLASGVSVVEIFDIMGEDVSGLRQLFADAFDGNIPQEFMDRFGFIIGLFNHLAREEIKGLVDSVSGLGQAIRGLGELGLLTAEDFDIFAGSVTNAFDELRSQGVGAKQAIAILGPQLQLLNDLSSEYGFTLDDNTQKLIDQAKEQGVVKDQSLSTTELLTRGFTGVIEALNEIIRQLGGIPIEFDIIKDKSKEFAEDTGRNLRDLGDEGVNAFEDIRRRAVETFDDIVEGSEKSARDSIGHWYALQDELIGNSVFPDSAAGALDAYKSMVMGAKTSARDIATLFAGSLGFLGGDGTSVRLPSSGLSTQLVLPGAPTPRPNRSVTATQALLQRIAKAVEDDKDKTIKIGEREFGTLVSRTTRRLSLDGRIELDDGAVSELQ